VSRLAKLPPYLFTEIDMARRQAEAAGRDVVDLGVGDPDQPTPAALVQILTAAAADPTSHRYPPNQGSRELRQAIARWLLTRRGIEVDPDRQVQVLIGSKEGLAHLPLALLEEGQEVLLPDPGYPVYTQATILAGGRPVPYRLRAAHAFQPRVEDLVDLVTDQTRLVYLNYPHNPTGAVADRELFDRVIELATHHSFVVANDAAYLEVVLAGSRLPSLLAGADLDRHRVIEFHSLSKMFNMTGWRIGFAVGHADLIRDLGRVKESIDSGVFGAVQAVATLALSEKFDELIAPVMAVYPPRREIIVQALRRAGIEVFPTLATFYVWSRVPDGDDSVSFCRRLLAQTDVVATPGVGFGPGGEGWFRLSLTAPDARISEAARRLERL
jgi:LL-diaminopimelate aminotransferase